MLGSSPLVAFVGLSDPEAALRFYGQILGLRLTADSPFALVFDAAGVMLRVTPVREVKPAPYTVLGWKVPDIAASIAGLAEHDASFERYEGIEQDAEGVWTAPGGAKVAWFRDPDGNLLSLTEFPKTA